MEGVQYACKSAFRKLSRTSTSYPRHTPTTVGVSTSAPTESKGNASPCEMVATAAMTALLYVPGLSRGAVEDFVHALVCEVSNTTIYNNVQAAGSVARCRQQASAQGERKRAVIGADGSFVKSKGG